MTTADLDLAVSFLGQYRPAGFWVLTSILPEPGNPTRTRTFTTKEIGELREWLKDQVDEKRNVYFHVNQTLRKMSKKAKEVDIAFVEWLHVDVDPDVGEDLREEQKRILAILEKSSGLPKSTLIVFSGGGYQAFWRLKNPYETCGSQEKADVVKRYNMQIELMLGADSCHDISRIMRVPGTINFPNEKKRKRGQRPVMAKVIKFTDDVYDISQFTAAPETQSAAAAEKGTGAPEVEISGNRPRIMDLNEELPKGVSDRAKVVIAQGKDPDQPLKGDNSRSEWLWHVVCELVRNEVDDDTIFSIITDPDFRISESVLDKGSPAAIERYAVKQIRDAKEECIEPMLHSFNKKYAIVEDVGGKFRIVKQDFNPALGRDETSFMLIDGFKNTYCNQFVQTFKTDAKGNVIPIQKEAGDWWLHHPNRRSYSRVVFAPNENHPGCLNLWRGFACDALAGEFSLFLDHILNVMCRGNRKDFEYLIGWMAWKIQNPGGVPQVAIVLRGEQGTGKGTFAELFGALFGCHYYHALNYEHVTGKFNGALEACCVLFADECFVPGSKLHESALKTLISEKTLNLEKKGIDIYVARNCLGLIMATNYNWAVPVAMDDRRFFILEISNDRKVDTTYFAAMREQMDNGGREAMLHYLLNYNLDGFRVNERPETEELQRQKMHSLTNEQGWWLRKLEDEKLLPDHGEWTSQAIADLLSEEYAEITGTVGRSAATRMGLFLLSVCPAGWPRKKHTRGQRKVYDTHGRERVLNRPIIRVFPNLAECRAEWERKFGQHDWPVITEADKEEVDPEKVF